MTLTSELPPTARDVSDILLDDVEFAYSRARQNVYDRLPVGSSVDQADLDRWQRTLLFDLERAERALRSYRAARWAAHEADYEPGDPVRELG